MAPRKVTRRSLLGTATAAGMTTPAFSVNAATSVAGISPSTPLALLYSPDRPTILELACLLTFAIVPRSLSPLDGC